MGPHHQRHGRPAPLSRHDPLADRRVALPRGKPPFRDAEQQHRRGDHRAGHHRLRLLHPLLLGPLQLHQQRLLPLRPLPDDPAAQRGLRPPRHGAALAPPLRHALQIHRHRRRRQRRSSLPATVIRRTHPVHGGDAAHALHAARQREGQRGSGGRVTCAGESRQVSHLALRITCGHPRLCADGRHASGVRRHLRDADALHDLHQHVSADRGAEGHDLAGRRAT